MVVSKSLGNDRECGAEGSIQSPPKTPSKHEGLHSPPFALSLFRVPRGVRARVDSREKMGGWMSEHRED